MAEHRSASDRDPTSADEAGIVDPQGALLDQMDDAVGDAAPAGDEGDAVPGDGSVPQSEPTTDVDDARQ